VNVTLLDEVMGSDNGNGYSSLENIIDQ